MTTATEELASHSISVNIAFRHATGRERSRVMYSFDFPDKPDGATVRAMMLRSLEEDLPVLQEAMEGNLYMAHVFALVDVVQETCLGVKQRPFQFEGALLTNQPFDNKLNRFPTLDKSPVPDPFLGLHRLRGPVHFVSMYVPGTDSQVILLGDHHAGSVCTAACPVGVGYRCASAQPMKDKRAGPLLGFDMSLFAHLDTTYGHMKPNVYLEAWMTDAVRAGTEADDWDSLTDFASVPAEDVYNMGPLSATMYHLRPCMVPATRDTAACPYRNIRVHAADPRVWDTKVWTPLYRLANAAASHSTRQVLEFVQWCQETHPDFSVEDIVRALFDQEPCASVTHAFCRRHSRVYHEVHQLPIGVSGRLIEATREVTLVRPLPYDIGAAVLAWLRQVQEAGDTGDDIVLHPLVLADLSQFCKNRMYTARAQAETNMYTIARILKQATARLHVVMLGLVHTELIARTMTTMGVAYAVAAGAAPNKCLQFEFKGGKKTRPTVRQWDAPEMEEEDGLTDIFAFDEDAPLQPLILPRPPYGIPKSSLAAWESLPTLPSVAAIDSVRT